MDTLSLTKEAKIYNREKTASSTSGAGKTEHFLTPYKKTPKTSKWIKDQNERPDTINS